MMLKRVRQECRWQAHYRQRPLRQSRLNTHAHHHQVSVPLACSRYPITYAQDLAWRIRISLVRLVVLEYWIRYVRPCFHVNVRRWSSETFDVPKRSRRWESAAAKSPKYSSVVILHIYRAVKYICWDTLFEPKPRCDCLRDWINHHGPLLDIHPV